MPTPSLTVSEFEQLLTTMLAGKSTLTISEAGLLRSGPNGALEIALRVVSQPRGSAGGMVQLRWDDDDTTAARWGEIKALLERLPGARFAPSVVDRHAHPEVSEYLVNTALSE